MQDVVYGALLLGVRAFEKTELNGTFNLYDAQMLHEEGKNEVAETRLSRAFHGRRKPLRFAAVQTDFAKKRRIACCRRDKDGKKRIS